MALEIFFSLILVVLTIYTILADARNKHTKESYILTWSGSTSAHPASVLAILFNPTPVLAKSQKETPVLAILFNQPDHAFI